MATENSMVGINPIPLLNPSYVVSLDIGSEKITGAIKRLDKSLVLKPTEFDNRIAGFEWLETQLNKLGVSVEQILIGLEATGRYWENSFYFFERKGYHLILLNPQQTHQWAERRSLRAKTDKLDTITIGRLLLSGEAKAGYVPSEQIVAYRELVRLHTNFTEQVARYRSEIHAPQAVLFPEFTDVFADPCGATALALLKCFPAAQAFMTAGVAVVAAKLGELAPRRFGLGTAQTLLKLAEASAASGVACQTRAKSLVMLAEQLLNIQNCLAEIEAELSKLFENDTGVAALATVKEFGPKTIAVLRAELGEVGRFAGLDQVVAYVGLDLEVKQSGKFKGQTKLSKRGSGLVRKTLYMTAIGCLRHRFKDSAFRTYYEAMLARGLKGKPALMALMRKMLAVAYGLLAHGGVYDSARVWVGAATARKVA